MKHFLEKLLFKFNYIKQNSFYTRKEKNELRIYREAFHDANSHILNLVSLSMSFIDINDPDFEIEDAQQIVDAWRFAEGVGSKGQSYLDKVKTIKL